MSWHLCCCLRNVNGPMVSAADQSGVVDRAAAGAAEPDAAAAIAPGNGAADRFELNGAPERVAGWATPEERRRMFILVRYVLIIAAGSLAILNARAALTYHQAVLVVAALMSNLLLSRVDPVWFFRWWVQGPIILADTVWIAVVLLSAGFGQQFFLFYFIELFLAAISESLGLLAVGATMIGVASIALGSQGILSAGVLIRVPFFFATAVFYGYVVDMVKQQQRFNLQRDVWAKQLEKEVRIRTHELERQSTELRRMYNEVRAADQLKSDFVANVSHEVRTPIHIIIGYADLALEDPELPRASEIRKFLQRILEQARGLHRLLENVLTYANLERGRASVSPRQFPMDGLVNDMRALCEDLPPQPRLTVRLQSPPGIEVTTDYERLHSVLSNLLLNAVKFTPAGEVELSTRAVGDEVEITVRDTGIGIAAQQLAHIFEPFRQADSSSTRSFAGVGLGLAIVSRNLKLLGGRIEVETAVGKGSTFRVHIPRSIDNRKWPGPSEASLAEQRPANGGSRIQPPPS
jgi:signal transduction histidine kinase